MKGTKKEQTLVVTRHPALVEYLKESGLLDGAYELMPEHLEVQDVANRNVIGILPFHLAGAANSYVYVGLELPKEAINRTLTVDDIRRWARPPMKFNIKCEVLPTRRDYKVAQFRRTLPAQFEPQVFFTQGSFIFKHEIGHSEDLLDGVVVAEELRHDFRVDLTEMDCTRWDLCYSIPKRMECIVLSPRHNLAESLSTKFGRHLGTWKDCATALQIKEDSLRKAWSGHRATTEALNKILPS